MLVISPSAATDAPVEMRTKAFISVWPDVERISSDVSPFEKIKSAYRHGEVFITMPPFRNFWVAALPGIRTVIDWRDGWSIAMASGYGGTCKSTPLKAALSKLVELTTILVADEIWTCTPGLLRYHSKGLPEFLRRKLRLIPNGHQMDITPERFGPLQISGPQLTAVCAGKFTVYGEDKVRRILDTLARRYPNTDIKIRVIGSPGENLEWVKEYIADLHYRIAIYQEPRKPYREIIADLSRADIAIAVIRDQAYDFGTKIFDYVAAGTPILDVFDNSDFRSYFSGCFDTDYDPHLAIVKARSFHRRMRVSDILGIPGQDEASYAGSGGSF